MMTTTTLDLITIGRSSVDLYTQQIGGRLEDAGTFVKAVGGCPTNIAIGTARLGLKSAVITRVGDEHMGRFIREQLARKARGDEEAMDFDYDYVRALEHGMPPAAGFGMGVDRLAMMLTAAPSIRDVILFPLMRPEALEHA